MFLLKIEPSDITSFYATFSPFRGGGTFPVFHLAGAYENYIALNSFRVVRPTAQFKLSFKLSPIYRLISKSPQSSLYISSIFNVMVLVCS